MMPSTSGRAASHPRRVDKLKFFHELKQLRDNVKSKLNKGESSDAVIASSNATIDPAATPSLNQETSLSSAICPTTPSVQPAVVSVAPPTAIALSVPAAQPANVPPVSSCSDPVVVIRNQLIPNPVIPGTVHYAK